MKDWECVMGQIKGKNWVV